MRLPRGDFSTSIRGMFSARLPNVGDHADQATVAAQLVQGILHRAQPACRD